MRKKLLNNSNLYLILDAQVNTHDELIEITRQAITAGVDIVQLRYKLGEAKQVISLAERLMGVIDDKVPFIINDRVDIAQYINASGVHLGQNDLPYTYAREILGEDKLIGMSCQSLGQALLAQELGADYIGFGSVYKTLTKPDRNPMNLDHLEEVVKRVSMPVYAIGGIESSNISELRNIGVEHFAVCRSICQMDDVAVASKNMKDLIVK